MPEGMTMLDLHAWDLAVATGQPYRPAEPNLQAAFALCDGIPDDPATRRGLFGPRLEVGDDASLLDRTLAAAGRDPGWQSPG